MDVDLAAAPHDGGAREHEIPWHHAKRGRATGSTGDLAVPSSCHERHCGRHHVRASATRGVGRRASDGVAMILAIGTWVSVAQTSARSPVARAARVVIAGAAFATRAMLDAWCDGCWRCSVLPRERPWACSRPWGSSWPWASAAAPTKMCSRCGWPRSLVVPSRAPGQAGEGEGPCPAMATSPADDAARWSAPRPGCHRRRRPRRGSRDVRATRRGRRLAALSGPALASAGAAVLC